MRRRRGRNISLPQGTPPHLVEASYLVGGKCFT
jgi:hypothetical protein